MCCGVGGARRASCGPGPSRRPGGVAVGCPARPSLQLPAPAPSSMSPCPRTGRGSDGPLPERPRDGAGVRSISGERPSQPDTPPPCPRPARARSVQARVGHSSLLVLASL